VRTHRLLAVAVMATLAFAACGKEANSPSATSIASASSSAGSKPAITIGSANFAESQILAEIYAQGLEAKGFKVTRKLNIGAREVYFPALESGKVNFFPEYIGSSLNYLTKQTDASKPDATQTYNLLQTELKKQHLTALKMASAADQDGVVVNKQTEDKYHFKNVSDLKAVASNLVFGGPPECPTRISCLKGLQDVYGIHFKDFKSLDPGGPLTIAALKSNGVQVADVFTTDASIGVNSFTVLNQDKPIVGAENVVPIVSDSVVMAGGATFTDTVNAITDKLTTSGLTDLNKKVSVDKQDASAVAKDWLQSNGLM
jgi:osmoprotectant transport system substrate-binding protein